jgi:stage IV sporulation protein FB
MIRFSLFGIPVEVQFFFWLSLAILGGALSADSSQAILSVGIFILAGFVSIMVHELGHALTAKKFGAYVSITLQAFGGYASYSGVRMSRVQSFLITAAGPAIQIALGIVTLLILLRLPQTGSIGEDFLKELTFISFFWAILNLIPVIPLDGGRLLETTLGPARIKITLWISIITSGVAGYLIYRRTGSLLFPIFLAQFGWQSFQQLRLMNFR